MAQAGKSSGKKKTTTKAKGSAKTDTKARQKTKTSSRDEKYVLTEKDKKLRSEIVLLLALGVTLLLLISNFGLISPVGDYISYFMFGLVGFLGYILPILIFVSAAFLISNRNNRRALVKFWSAAGLFVTVISLIQIVFFGYDSSKTCFYYYSYCGGNKTGGGMLGALIVNMFSSVVGVVGTYILLFVFIIICCVLLTEKSFINGVKQGSKKVYHTAREDVDRIRDNVKESALEREYQKNRRIHKVVKGVNLSRIEDPERVEEQMHEITPEKNSFVKSVENVSKPQTSTRFRVTPVEEPQEKAEPQKVVPKNAGSQKTAQRNAEPEREESPKPQNRVYVDEEGNYQMKEEIIVSESARQVMNRPAFSMTTAAPKVKVEVVQDTEAVAEQQRQPDTGAELGPDGAVKIAQADVENSVYEPQTVEKIPKKSAKKYVLPRTALLNRNQGASGDVNRQELQVTARKLEEILKNFGVKASVTDYNRGPSVTRYEIQPEIGTRLNKITTLADDIKLNLAATDIRIEPIPGKSTIGIEVPNKVRESVLIRELIESSELCNHKSKLAFAAGKDIAGQVVVADIAKMPHFLIAGTTGSGKSVFTNSIIMSILFRATPEEVRLIIVDPKVVEFGIYNGIPHLLQPVVTDAKLASNTLKWAVAEMSQRYKLFAEYNVRDLKGYNEKIAGMDFMKEEERPKKLPQIVIVIDELADLMMVAAKEVEESICRLAQLARAAGIHLIIATQRPSVDVVTGLIKANIPSRCALMVSSGVDSRTIIDSVGAEKLLGNGDMLFYPSGYVKPVRLQGAFVSDAEVERVVEFWKAQADGTNYDESIAEYVANQPAEDVRGVAATGEPEGDGRDEYFADAARMVVEKQRASVSRLQTVFKVGYSRASRIMEQLEKAGIVGEEEGTKPRKVLMTQMELENYLNQ